MCPWRRVIAYVHVPNLCHECLVIPILQCKITYLQSSMTALEDARYLLQNRLTQVCSIHCRLGVYSSLSRSTQTHSWHPYRKWMSVTIVLYPLHILCIRLARPILYLGKRKVKAPFAFVVSANGFQLVDLLKRRPSTLLRHRHRPGSRCLVSCS